MKLLIDTYKKTGQLHHAYLFEGGKDNVLLSLKKFLEKEVGIVIHGNPDFSISEFETLTVDDSREITLRQSRRGLTSKKIFIIQTRFITTEAQNALLKTFEEPTADTHFFLIMPTIQTLLPTLRSRLMLIPVESSNSEEKISLKKFLEKSGTERLLMLKNIIEEKDKGAAIDFVSSLERELAKDVKKNKESLEQILMVKKYLHDRSPSLKLLLEHLALVI